MARPITIITGQFGDVMSDELFAKMAEIGEQLKEKRGEA